MAFGRVIKVKIGPPGQEGLLITDLTVEFNIEKNTAETTNVGRINIYNLAAESIARVAKAGYHVILIAGYEDETAGELFYGDIKHASPRQDGNDIVLEIEAYDGQTTLERTTSSVSYRAGVNARTIIGDLQAAFNYDATIGLQLVPIDVTYPKGYVFSGKTKDALTEVLNKCGLKWMVQNEKLVIYNPGQSTGETGLKLTASTGLVISPEPVEDKTADPTTDTAAMRWKVTALLFPQLIPGARVQIESRSLNGTFVIEKSTFSGNNRDGDFKVDMVVRAEG